MKKLILLTIACIGLLSCTKTVYFKDKPNPLVDVHFKVICDHPEDSAKINIVTLGYDSNIVVLKVKGTLDYVMMIPLNSYHTFVLSVHCDQGSKDFLAIYYNKQLGKNEGRTCSFMDYGIQPIRMKVFCHECDFNDNAKTSGDIIGQN